MAKKKSKKMQKKQRSRARRPLVLGAELDAGARAHVALMVDPCNAKLCLPAYESPAGGTLVRLRRTFVVGQGTGETAGVITFFPGANYYLANGATSSTATFTPTGNNVFPFLVSPASSSSAKEYRCVAACLKMQTLSSELNRSGIVSAGLQPAGYVAAGTSSLTVGSVQQNLPTYVRMPSDSLEVLWLPGSQDTVFTTSSPSDVPIASQGWPLGNSVTIAFTGAPAQVGVQFEFTAVYEVILDTAQGFVSQLTAPPSTSTWNQTLSAAFRAIGNNPVIVNGLHRLAEVATERFTGMLGNAARVAARNAPLLLTM